jgi:hypothetical protein
MKFNQDFAYGLVIGVIVVFVINFFAQSKKVSGFVQSEADGFFPLTMDRASAQASFQQRSTQIATDLAALIQSMVQQGRTPDEIITSSHAAADQANMLNKAFAAYQIRRAMSMPPGAPSPQ